MFFIELPEGMNNFIRVQCADFMSFNERVGTIYAVIRTTALGLHIDHPALVPVKINEAGVKVKVGRVDKAFSAVNLDEEAANLMKYQRSYEAAAKVIQIGDSIIQSLLDVVRG